MRNCPKMEQPAKKTETKSSTEIRMRLWYAFLNFLNRKRGKKNLSNRKGKGRRFGIIYH